MSLQYRLKMKMKMDPKLKCNFDVGGKGVPCFIIVVIHVRDVVGMFKKNQFTLKNLSFHLCL